MGQLENGRDNLGVINTIQIWTLLVNQADSPNLGIVPKQHWNQHIRCKELLKYSKTSLFYSFQKWVVSHIMGKSKPFIVNALIEGTTSTVWHSHRVLLKFIFVPTHATLAPYRQHFIHCPIHCAVPPIVLSIVPLTFNFSPSLCFPVSPSHSYSPSLCSSCFVYLLTQTLRSSWRN